ncbi:2-aminoethylphosphonate:pyruvate aminotransferase [Pontibacillus halophilus JSM 076056 = DSM 19796]|uniref:2-aminoethylphosphonate--pyruvate transaminase n=1 Tax=Pontibacillus halophilus JSM 076056 = DSM 19796 TaxID=1385510 RepID=A0A0A5GL97_9BACI|nr:2-aminoethylphosphonate--pyruvate transaminase [Pontibacillus halophilus]KGX94016.1 2-aminoethylphosphonate:pyruvate aminotransferase [Pontibacillus halophilus JSM 076056 = DSM 19796]
MRATHDERNPYLLLTPGPLTTTSTVKEAMLKDWCTWDDDYKHVVQSIRQQLLQIGHVSDDVYTSVLMQGSGTFTVESVIGTVIPNDGKLLVLVNGVYGARIAEISERLGIETIRFEQDETEPIDLEAFERHLQVHKDLTHVAVVHCETTTGMLNPLQEISKLVKAHDKTLIVDAMSSFGGIPIHVPDLQADYLISSANKCIQGVPGFGFVLARREALKQCKGQARSLSLDLYDQWEVMEHQSGKWRFTSPTHTVRAFQVALEELEAEGGVTKRYERYTANQRTLVHGMRTLGFSPVLEDDWQSPFITSYYYPEHEEFTFEAFYSRLKEKGFVIYPGKVTNIQSFRIGTIGNIDKEDVHALLSAIEASMYWTDERIEIESRI